jgi:hypothetical protein
VLAFAVGLALVTGVAFGLVPAWRAGRVATVTTLGEIRHGLGLGGARVRRALVALQVGLSVILLVGAGLFVRSLGQAYAIDPGLDLDRLLNVQVDLQRAGYSPEEREQFYDEAQRSLRALPQVEAAAMVHFTPFSGMAQSITWEFPGADVAAFREGLYRNLAAPGFFATLGTELLMGREFVPADALGDPTAIINDRMARALVPDGNAENVCVALGEQVANGGCTRVVGVVETYRHRYLDEAEVPMIFLPRERDPAAITFGSPALVVRTWGKAEAATTAVRTALQSLRSDLPYVAVEPLERLARLVPPGTDAKRRLRSPPPRPRRPCSERDVSATRARCDGAPAAFAGRCAPAPPLHSHRPLLEGREEPEEADALQRPASHPASTESATASAWCWPRSNAGPDASVRRPPQPLPLYPARAGSCTDVGPFPMA